MAPWRPPTIAFRLKSARKASLFPSPFGPLDIDEIIVLQIRITLDEPVCASVEILKDDNLVAGLQAACDFDDIIADRRSGFYGADMSPIVRHAKHHRLTLMLKDRRRRDCDRLLLNAHPDETCDTRLDAQLGILDPHEHGHDSDLCKNLGANAQYLPAKRFVWEAVERDFGFLPDSKIVETFEREINEQVDRIRLEYLSDRRVGGEKLPCHGLDDGSRDRSRRRARARTGAQAVAVCADAVLGAHDAVFVGQESIDRAEHLQAVEILLCQLELDLR